MPDWLTRSAAVFSDGLELGWRTAPSVRFLGPGGWASHQSRLAASGLRNERASAEHTWSGLRDSRYDYLDWQHAQAGHHQRSRKSEPVSRKPKRSGTTVVPRIAPKNAFRPMAVPRRTNT